MSTKVTLLGTGVGIPQPGRSQSAILVETERPLLLDCGAGTLLRLDEAGIDVENLDTVLLTHLHLDHVSDLLALANARYLRRLPGLEVYGPVGTAAWFETLHSAFPYLEKMEVTAHEVRPMDDFSVQGFDIFAEEARHSVTALAYRGSSKGADEAAPLHDRGYPARELVIAASTEAGATPSVTMAAINSTHRRRVDQSSISGVVATSFSPNTAWRTTWR